MVDLTLSSSQNKVAKALASLSPSKGIIVGPGWVDIATPGEIRRQLRRERIGQLASGIYISLHGDNTAMMQTISLLAAVDSYFEAAEKAFRQRNPAPPVGKFVPRRPKHPKLVAHGWGHSSEGPMGCAQVRGLDRTLAESLDFVISQHPTT